MKNNQNPFQKTLKNLSISESASFQISDRAQIAEEVNSLNGEVNGYQFTLSQNSKKNGTFTVTRVVPTRMLDRAKYVDSIRKSTINQALRDNSWNKVRASAALNISPRTLGRLISRHQIAERKRTSRVSA
jgi:transcriptional regulator with GAF, ATPase, and Fis domain